MIFFLKMYMYCSVSTYIYIYMLYVVVYIVIYIYIYIECDTSSSSKTLVVSLWCSPHQGDLGPELMGSETLTATEHPIL